MELSLPDLAPAGLPVERGTKREQEPDDAADDSERNVMVRHEELESHGTKRGSEAEAEAASTPRSSRARSSNWNGDENTAMDNLNRISREEYMQIVRERLR